MSVLPPARDVAPGFEPRGDGRVSATNAAIADRFGLGDLDQVSFAVANVDDAVRRYEPVFGPFRVTNIELDDIVYRGEPSSVSLRVALGEQASIEIELIEVLQGYSPTADHLAEHGEGLHHIRFRVADLSSTQAAMGKAGFTTSFLGEKNGTRFAYLDAPALLGTTSIELMQPPSNGS